MSQNIYELLQAIIPELAQQDLPENLEQFTIFRDWLNQTYSYLQYVEIKEFDDNGIEDNQLFKQKDVDVQALQSKIQNDVWALYEQVGEEMDDMQDVDAFMNKRIEVEQKVEDILFDHIKVVAEANALSLWVIIRENPYWLLVPCQDMNVLENIVDVFNQTFNMDGDLNMVFN